MRVIIQRVSEAELKVDGQIKCSIQTGMVILLGIDQEDSEEDLNWLVPKIIGLRIFNDKDQLMNLSLADISGEIMIVSQFTLFASTKKGNRPSFLRSAKPEMAKDMYNRFIDRMKSLYHNKIVTGIFGSDMKISLCNDGPVSIILDTKNKE